MSMTVGQNLKKVRQSKGISQVELSKKTGIDRKIIIGYEYGKHDMNLTNAFKISKAIGVSVDSLMQDTIALEIPKTNIERMKSFNIEQMAGYLTKMLFCPYEKCKNKTQNASCYKCIKEWLQKEDEA